jgi:hypothetical protein
VMHDTSNLKLVEAAEKGFASGGSKGMLQNMLDLQKRFYDRGQLSPYWLAETAGLLGDKQDALKYLQIAYDNHDENAHQMANDPAFASVRNEPAYQDLAAKTGIPVRN